MKLLMITLMLTMATCINAAGGEGAVGSPGMQLISVTPIDNISSLECYRNNGSNEIMCKVVNH